MYQTACLEVYESIREKLTSWLAGRDEYETDVMTSSLLVYSFNQVPDSSLAFLCKPVHFTDQHGMVRWRLQLPGAYETKDRDSPEALRPLIDEYRALAAGISGWEKVQELEKWYQAACAAVQSFQEALSPDARLRKLVLEGRCALCPQSSVV